MRTQDKNNISVYTREVRPSSVLKRKFHTSVTAGAP